MREFGKALGELPQQEFLTLDPFSHHLKFDERLALLLVEFCYPCNIVDDLPPLEITHLDDAGDVPLHDNIISMRLDPVLRQVIIDIRLLGEPVVKVNVAIIPGSSPLDTTAYPGTVGEG